MDPSAESSCLSCGAPLRQGICPRCFITSMMSGDGDQDEETPVQLGDYDLIEEIARGGMGVVWRARQRQLNRIVALKLLRESALPGETGARRFRIEAEAAAALRHPHIVSVHEVGETGGRWFLSMELLAGSLADKLRAGRMAPRPAGELLAKIARAVQYAHDRGILHRDLKPANVLLDDTGEPRVSDFGLARVEARPDHITASGASLGTPAYMPPEQAAGKHREITTASDVYGLGTILYEALTGKPPFTGSSQLEVLRRVTDDEPARPSGIAPGIDRDLDTICLRCLQKEPARRYPSALALAEDIDHWLRGEPISARPAGPMERIWKWARRRPAVAGLWIIAVLALSGGIVAGALYTVRLEHERRAALHRVAHQHVQTALGLTESGEWHRALLYLTEAVEMGTGDPARDRINRLRFECLVRQSPRLVRLWFFSGEDVPRHVEFSADGTSVLLLHKHNAQLFDATTGAPLGPRLEQPAEIVAGDTDVGGTRVVCGSADGSWTLWDPRAGSIVARGEGRLRSFPPPGVSRVSGTFGGDRFVTVRGRTAQCFLTESGASTGPPVLRQAPILWAVLTPDGKTVLSLTDDLLFRPGTDDGPGPQYLCASGAQHMYFYKGKAEMRMDALMADKGWCSIVHWPDNAPERESTLREPILAQTFRGTKNWVILTASPGGASLVDGWSPVLPQQLDHGASGVAGAFDEGGITALTLASDGSARQWDLASCRPLGTRLRVIGVPSGIALSRDGKSIVLRSEAPALWLWRQPPPSVVTAPPPPANPESRSTDGRLLFRIGSDASVVLHDAASGTVLFAPLRHPAPVAEAAFSPDSALLATRAGDHIRVWETATGQPVMPPSNHPGAAEIRWRADSAALYTRGTDGWRMLDMSPGTRSLTDMKTLARLLAAGRLVSGNEDGIVPLTAEELRAAWEHTQNLAYP